MPSARPELRECDRHCLKAPVVFRWDDGSGSKYEGQGLTSDISMMGMYVRSSECPPAGTIVRLRVSLPSLSGSGWGWRLDSTGYVVRLYKDGSSMEGFAVYSGKRKARLEPQLETEMTESALKLAPESTV